MLLAYIFLLLAIAFRFAPHPMAFTPIGASLLFFGARVRPKHFWVPLLLLGLADLALTRLVYSYPYMADQFISLAWYAAALWIGTNLTRNARPGRVFAAALAASVSFFIVSNFGVWAVYPNMYPRNLGGLAAAYIAALPFFRNDVAANLVFSALFFVTPLAWRTLSGSPDEAGTDRIAAS
jgi:hypothetical protein